MSLTEQFRAMTEGKPPAPYRCWRCNAEQADADWLRGDDGTGCPQGFCRACHDREGVLVSLVCDGELCRQMV
jgi:hypothetical protein